MPQVNTYLAIPETFRENFRINLKILREINRGLFKRISEIQPWKYLEPARDGSFTLKVDHIYLESRNSPFEVSLKYIEHLNESIFSEGIICLGCGLGYHINKIFKKQSFPIILVEKDLRVFSAALYILNPEVLKKIIPLVDCPLPQAAYSLTRFCKSQLVVHPHSFRLNRDYYLKIKQLLKSHIQVETASRVTESKSRNLWVRNIFKNISNLNDKFYATNWLKGAFTGPAALVASGPFLEDARETLKSVGKSLTLFALLPSVPYLLNNGIVPDFVLTTDAGFGNRLRFIRDVKLPLFTTYSADPVLLKNWGGEIFMFSHLLPLEQKLSGINELSLKVPMQGTSSAVMILLARQLGFSPLYLAGYDFAVKGIKDHHQGAGFDDHFICISSRLKTWYTMVVKRLKEDFLLEVNTCSGAKTLTTHKLLLYRNWIQDNVSGPDLFRLNDGTIIKGIKSVCTEKIFEVVNKRSKIDSMLLKKASGHIISSEIVAQDLLKLKKLVDHYRLIKNSSGYIQKDSVLGNCSVESTIKKIHSLFFGEEPGFYSIDQLKQEVIKAISMLEKSRKSIKFEILNSDK